LTRKTCYIHKYSTSIGDDHTTDSTGPDGEIRAKVKLDIQRISQKGQSVYETISETLVEINEITQFLAFLHYFFSCFCYYKNFTYIIRGLEL